MREIHGARWTIMRGGGERLSDPKKSATLIRQEIPKAVMKRLGQLFRGFMRNKKKMYFLHINNLKIYLIKNLWFRILTKDLDTSLYKFK